MTNPIDIVTRLRLLMHLKGCNRDCGEAADEIERLREAITAMAEQSCDQRNEVERLRAISAQYATRLGQSDGEIDRLRAEVAKLLRIIQLCGAPND